MKLTYENALEKLKKDKNDPQALYDLGVCYQFGIEESPEYGVKRNLEIAMGYFRKALERYEDTKFLAKNPKKIVDIDINIAKCYQSIGRCYEYTMKSIIESQRSVKSYNLARKEKSKAYKNAFNKWVEVKSYAIVNDIDDAAIEAQRYIIGSSRIEKNIATTQKEKLRKDKNDAQALFILGICHQFGECEDPTYGVKRDLKEAIKYYEVALNKYNHASLFPNKPEDIVNIKIRIVKCHKHIAQCYEAMSKGQEPVFAYSMAYKSFTKSYLGWVEVKRYATDNHVDYAVVEAQKNIIKHLLNGLGVKKNIALALEEFNNLTKEKDDNFEFQNYIALRFCYEKDYETAYEILLNLAIRNDKTAQNILNDLDMQNDIVRHFAKSKSPKSYNAFLVFAILGHKEARNNLKKYLPSPKEALSSFNTANNFLSYGASHTHNMYENKGSKVEFARKETVRADKSRLDDILYEIYISNPIGLKSEDVFALTRVKIEAIEERKKEDRIESDERKEKGKEKEGVNTGISVNSRELSFELSYHTEPSKIRRSVKLRGGGSLLVPTGDLPPIPSTGGSSSSFISVAQRTGGGSSSSTPVIPPRDVTENEQVKDAWVWPNQIRARRREKAPLLLPSSECGKKEEAIREEYYELSNSPSIQPSDESYLEVQGYWFPDEDLPLNRSLTPPSGESGSSSSESYLAVSNNSPYSSRISSRDLSDVAPVKEEKGKDAEQTKESSKVEGPHASGGNVKRLSKIWNEGVSFLPSDDKKNEDELDFEGGNSKPSSNFYGESATKRESKRLDPARFSMFGGSVFDKRDSLITKG